jgi:zinc protease
MLCATPALAAITVKTTSIRHGVEAWYAPSAAVPIVDVVLTFEGAGNASDPESKTGRASFAAAMIGEGAGDLSAQAFAEALEEKAITLTANANADQLTIHVRCLREQASRAGELLALALTQPALKPEDVDRIKNQITSVLSQLEGNPNYQAEKLLRTRAFKNHPYANAPYGNAQTLETLGADDVRSYLQTYVTRGNLLIAAAGDIDSSTLDALVGPTIDALKNNDSGAVAVTPIVPQGGGETLKQITTLPQTVIAFVSPGITRTDKRFYAAYLLNHILGGGSLSSRLGQTLRQKSGLAYSIDTDLDIRRGTTMFSGALATRNASAEQALAELKTELASVREHGVTTQECNDAKSYVLGHFPLQLDRTTAISALLTTMQTHKLGKDYLDKRTDYFKNVSCGDINAVASELLAPEKFLFAIVGGTPDPAAPTPAIAPVSPAHNDAR